MNDCSKPASTPLAPHFKCGASLSPSTDEKQEFMARVPYPSLVGSLMYVMVCTKPNILHVSMVSQYMCHPRKKH